MTYRIKFCRRCRRPNSADFHTKFVEVEICADCLGSAVAKAMQSDTNLLYPVGFSLQEKVS